MSDRMLKPPVDDVLVCMRSEGWSLLHIKLHGVLQGLVGHKFLYDICSRVFSVVLHYRYTCRPADTNGGAASGVGVLSCRPAWLVCSCCVLCDVSVVHCMQPYVLGFHASCDVILVAGSIEPGWCCGAGKHSP